MVAGGSSGRFCAKLCIIMEASVYLLCVCVCVFWSGLFVCGLSWFYSWFV